ncbi:MAG: NfeD family protein [Acidilobus sp.]
MRGWPTLFGLLLATLGLIGLTTSFTRAQQGLPVILVNFNVPVDLGSSTMMARVVETAETLHAKAVVIVMNTPGGYLSDMLKIVGDMESLQSYGIPVYTYVPPDGMAASAGSYIAMASNGIIMANGTFIGPSTPIVVGGTPLEQNHTEAAMLAFMESLASKWGRNATAASYMVLYDEAYTAQQALRYHLINGISNSLQGALAAWNLTGYPQLTMSESLYEQFLSVLSNPTVDGLLISLGFLVVLLDLYHPTFLLSAIGIIAIALGLVGAEIIGASAIGLTLILIGAALMLLELKMGHGLAVMAGAVLSAVGIYLMALNIPYVTTSAPTAPKAILEDSAIAVVGVAAGLYIRWIVGPARRKRVMAGPESLIGAMGVAVSDLGPEGEVRVEGIIWRAKSMTPVKAGSRVKVIGREGLALVVEPIGEARQPET